MILAILGVVIIFGAVGNDDLMMALGVAYPLRYTLLKILVGCALIIPEGVLAWVTKD
jgi:hypothetical protein